MDVKTAAIQVLQQAERPLHAKEFSSLGLFENAAAVSDLIGNNLPHLRRLSQVKKGGYYKDPHFLANLRKVSKEDGWGIQYSPDGRLLVTEDDIETVVRVLNNDRLTWVYGLWNTPSRKALPGGRWRAGSFLACAYMITPVFLVAQCRKPLQEGGLRAFSVVPGSHSGVN